jgi:hypothetical protein
MTAPFPVRSGVLGANLPGLDLKGVGGYIVAEPSVHPGTGRQYVWVRTPRQRISRAPARLAEVLPRHGGPPRAGVGRPMGEVAGGDARRAEPTRTGDAAALARELVERFPVEGPGRRHDRMCAAIGSLAGRGYPDGTILEALGIWYDRFRELGRIRTGRPEADAEAERCLRATRANPRFSRASGVTDHEAACREIELGDELVRLIRSGRFPVGPGAGPSVPAGSATLPGGDCKGVTRIGSNRYDGWGLSAREYAFVEVVVIHAMYNLRCVGADGEAPLVAMTDGQLRGLASARHPGVSWSGNQQTEREKRKFVSREGKPAGRYELLAEVIKGWRTRDGAGTPSVYRATGVMALLRIGREDREAPGS